MTDKTLNPYKRYVPVIFEGWVLYKRECEALYTTVRYLHMRTKIIRRNTEERDEEAAGKGNENRQGKRRARKEWEERREVEEKGVGEKGNIKEGVERYKK